MNNHTAAALRTTAYQLRDEAVRAERTANRLQVEAKEYEDRAQGLRDAAEVIATALDEANQ